MVWFLSRISPLTMRCSRLSRVYLSVRPFKIGLVVPPFTFFLSLNVQGPFTSARDGFGCPVCGDSIHIHLTATDHEIGVDHALVASSCCKFLSGHLLTAFNAEAKGATEGDMVRSVLIEQRVVEQ